MIPSVALLATSIVAAGTVTSASSSSNPFFTAQLEDTCDLTCANGGYCTYIYDSQQQLSWAASQGTPPQRCVCRPGFGGTACELRVQECSFPERRCYNGAPCIQTVDDTWTCDCQIADAVSAFAGRMCRHANEFTEYCTGRFDNEDRTFCVNGGKCVSDFVGAQVAPGNTTANTLYQHMGCVCNDAFAGPHCERLNYTGSWSEYAPASHNPRYLSGLFAVAGAAAVAILALLTFQYVVMRRRRRRCWGGGGGATVVLSEGGGFTDHDVSVMTSGHMDMMEDNDDNDHIVESGIMTAPRTNKVTYAASPPAMIGNSTTATTGPSKLLMSKKKKSAVTARHAAVPMITDWYQSPFDSNALNQPVVSILDDVNAMDAGDTGTVNRDALLQRVPHVDIRQVFLGLSLAAPSTGSTDRGESIRAWNASRLLALSDAAAAAVDRPWLSDTATRAASNVPHDDDRDSDDDSAMAALKLSTANDNDDEVMYAVEDTTESYDSSASGVVLESSSANDTTTSSPTSSQFDESSTFSIAVDDATDASSSVAGEGVFYFT